MYRDNGKLLDIIECLGWWKCYRKARWPYNVVNKMNATELYILKWLTWQISCYTFYHNDKKLHQSLFLLSNPPLSVLSFISKILEWFIEKYTWISRREFFFPFRFTFNMLWSCLSKTSYLAQSYSKYIYKLVAFDQVLWSETRLVVSDSLWPPGLSFEFSRLDYWSG